VAYLFVERFDSLGILIWIIYNLRLEWNLGTEFWEYKRNSV
jgi:hypothetical protein